MPVGSRVPVAPVCTSSAHFYLVRTLVSTGYAPRATRHSPRPFACLPTAGRTPNAPRPLLHFIVEWAISNDSSNRTELEFQGITVKGATPFVAFFVVYLVAERSMSAATREDFQQAENYWLHDLPPRLSEGDNR